METTTVNIENFPKELWKRVGLKAITEEVTKKDIVIKALERYLNEEDGKWHQVK